MIRIMLEARLVITDEARVEAPELDSDRLITVARTAGWDLRSDPQDERAEIVVFGLDADVHIDTVNSRIIRPVPDSVPFFWIKPLGENPKYNYDPIRFDWYAAPRPPDEPHDHGWTGQSYGAGTVIYYLTGWFRLLIATRGLRIFISYASEDVALAATVAEVLESHGHDVWFDRRRLIPGQDWDLEIREAIRRTEAVIVLISPRSVSKIGYVQKEMRSALDAAEQRPDGRVFILPLTTEGVQLPDRLRRLQYVDVDTDDWSRQVERSLDLIRNYR
jgi:hypothetical protein